MSKVSNDGDLTDAFLEKFERPVLWIFAMSFATTGFILLLLQKPIIGSVFLFAGWLCAGCSEWGHISRQDSRYTDISGITEDSGEILASIASCFVLLLNFLETVWMWQKFLLFSLVLVIVIVFFL